MGQACAAEISGPADSSQALMPFSGRRHRNFPRDRPKPQRSREEASASREPASNVPDARFELMLNSANRLARFLAVISRPVGHPNSSPFRITFILAIGIKSDTKMYEGHL